MLFPSLFIEICIQKNAKIISVQLDGLFYKVNVLHNHHLGQVTA